MSPTAAVIRKAYVDTGHGQMHCRMVDGPHAESPVVLFHRTPVTSASFDRLMQHLAGWRRLIAFDTPGFGQSFVPPADAPMDMFTDAFVNALDGLGARNWHLVGHHTGAHFATELAVRYSACALSLMIDGAMAPSDEERARVAPPPPDTVVDEQGDYARNAWAFLRPYYTVFDERCIHDEYVGALASQFTRSACMRLVRGHDMAGLLASTTLPLIASAAEDDVFVPHLDHIRQARPDALVRLYGPAGIAAPELQTDAFASLVREAVALGEATAGRAPR
jgi:pimeloyl-ACP methyl ester carboxylesterase